MTAGIPRLPVFGWQAFSGARDAGTSCMLSLPAMHFTTSGRASILLALEVLGVGPGDAVLLPSYHCPTMVAPAADRSAVPHFYPIDERGSPRLDWLQAQDLRGVRAMLVAHYFGLPQPMAALRAWCDERGIALIEDCAHALFGRSGERPVGGWGDVAIGSLTKFLPVPEGGCLVLNRGGELPTLSPCGAGAQLRAAVDILEVGAVQGRLTGLNSVVAGGLQAMRKLRGKPSPAHGGAVPSGPAPSPAPQAAADPTLLTAADRRIDTVLAHRALSTACGWVATHMPRERIVAMRRHHYADLARRLSGHRGLRPLLPSLPEHCAPYVFPLWVDKPDPGYAELRRLRMPVFRWNRLWPGIGQLPGDQGPTWSHHVLQLGCHQDLQTADLDHFVQALLRLYAD